MNHSLYAFVEDFAAEGTEPALDRIAELGVDGVTIAAAYHRARDVTPHAPGRVTIRHDGLRVSPIPGGFEAGSLPVQVVTTDGDAVIDRARSAGLAVDGWAVCCHNTTIGLQMPEVTTLSCFGTHPSPADLCPAQSRVRRYVVDLARTVAARGVDRVVLESAHFGMFGHGYHHERSFVELGGLEQFLFSLCFCEACSAAVREMGADPDAIRGAAVAHLDTVLSGTAAPTPLTDRGQLAEVHPEVDAVMVARCGTVTSLIAEVVAETPGVGVSVIDLSGAILGYADGRPGDVLAADTAWQMGLDPAAVTAAADYAVLAYAHDVERVVADLRRYRELIGTSRNRLDVVLRPSAPDTADAAHLADKVDAIGALADGIDFYNYGLASRTDLDRVRTALRPVGGSR